MRKIFKLSLGVVLIFLGVSSCSNIKEKFSPNTLIPRSELFAAPDRYCPHLSPDGHFISYIAHSGNELELKIESISDRKQVKSFKVKGCIGTYYYEWCYTNKHIIVPQDNGGDENDYIVCLNIETGEAKKITQFQKISQVEVISPYFPEEVIISNNDRAGEFFDYYKINVVTGKCEKIFENNEYFRVCFNKKFQLKILQKILSNGDIQNLTPSKGKVPVAYVLYSDEGHGFMREPNEKSYMAFSEKFLSKFLGGRCEPIGENELQGSSHWILEGKEILEIGEK